MLLGIPYLWGGGFSGPVTLGLGNSRESGPFSFSVPTFSAIFF